MNVRNFKVTSVTTPRGTNAPGKRIEFTCEGKGRLVDWNWIEGYSFGPLENDVWPAEWVVIIQRGGKEVKRRMKLSERSKAITRAIKSEVARYLALNGLKDSGPQSGPQKTSTPWPAKGNSGSQKTVARTVALPKEDPEVTLHNIQGGPQKDPLEMPEFLRR